MKNRFTALSLQIKILSIIGFSILTATVLELVLLFRNFPATSGTISAPFSAQALILGLNSALFLIIAVLIRHVYACHIQHPLHELSRLLQQPLAHSHEAPVFSSASREIHDFSTTVLARLSALHTLLEQTIQIAEPMLEASQILFSSSQSQASRIEFQRPSQHDMRRSIQELVGTARQVSQDIHTVVDISADTLRIANRGQQSVLNVSANIEDIRRSSRLSAEKIAALEKQTEQIHDVVATIDSIIEDTKLIAFNATIEAARVKDEGKGFSVVALEIKRLAEEVFESTEEIKEFIQDIQHTSQALVVSMESELKSVQRGRALAEESGLALQHIVDMVKRTSESARHIAANSEQQQETSEHALQLVETATRSLDQLGRDMRTFTTTSGHLRQQAEALVRILRQPTL